MKRSLLVILVAVMVLPGCSYIQKIRKFDDLQEENLSLRNKVLQLQKEKGQQKVEVQEKEQKLSELEQAKRELEEKLKKEIGEYKAKLQMTERGLVITFLSEIFFDSGKDVIRTDGEHALKSVAEVLNKEAKDSLIAVEGHTDNDPIKRSAWKSNWELSSARALAVLHFLVDSCELKPERLSIAGYGQYHPVTANDTFKGKQQNRRVEIVILPAQLKKVKQ
jgi:chemotaxis protein MotB